MRAISAKLDTPPADERVAAVAARQHGVVSAAQLVEHGLTHHRIRQRERTGRLHRLHRGVYAVGHPGVSREGWFLAAVLCVGRGACLSHISAAELWGLLSVQWKVVHVLVAGGPATERRGIRLHRTRALPPRDVTRHRAIPVTTPGRTLLDLADVAGLPDRALRRAVREAEVQRLVEHRDLQARLDVAGNGRRGAGRLREIVGAGPAPTRSELEDRTLDLLVRHRFPPPQINAAVRAGGRVFEVDFLFAERRLVLEADGERFHGTPAARQADAARQAALEAAGWRVIRLTWGQVVREEAQTVARLRRVLSDQAPPPRRG
jgi:very-short-patch-repair endonuclease/predicted transcriptional regulator of viral defense system